jgi:hypothetical protein
LGRVFYDRLWKMQGKFHRKTSENPRLCLMRIYYNLYYGKYRNVSGRKVNSAASCPLEETENLHYLRHYHHTCSQIGGLAMDLVIFLKTASEVRPLPFLSVKNLSEFKKHFEMRRRAGGYYPFVLLYLKDGKETEHHMNLAEVESYIEGKATY